MSGDNGPTGEVLDMAGARFELVARMGSGEADAVLFRTRMAAGKVVPLHSHSDPEGFYVISGSIEVFVDDDRPGWRRVEAGRSLVMTDGIKHAIRNVANEPADMIVMTNNRLARYFRDVGRQVGSHDEPLPPGPGDIERIVRGAEAYGYWLASPAESAAVTGQGPL